MFSFVMDQRYDTQDPTLNPLGLDGLEFVEYASPDPTALEQLFCKFGFLKIGQHKRKQVTLYRQNQINFVINNEPGTFAARFAKHHGPSICATGYRVKSAVRAFDQAVARGARPIEAQRHDGASHSFPAIYGIGESAIYFVDRYKAPVHFDDDFRYLVPERIPKGSGLLSVDHMSNNVPKGEIPKWRDFYVKIFNFREQRKFGIEGQATGLFGQTLKSPCDKIRLVINEPREGKSQIQEFLDAYHGSGIQHLALSTTDIHRAVRLLRENEIRFLESPSGPITTEAAVMVDGRADAHVLEAFTQKLIGPIFFEIIQRHNQRELGEQNIRALFCALEREQFDRGYL